MINTINTDQSRNINLITTIVVILVIVALNYIRSSALKIIQATATPTSKLEVTVWKTTATPLGFESILYAEYELNPPFCIGEGIVDYFDISIDIKGGTAPYFLRITNIEGVQEGPNLIPSAENPIPIRIYGGESIFVEVWSYGKTLPGWSQTIIAPYQDPSCSGTLTPSLIPTISPSPTSTLSPTQESITPSP